MVTKLTRVGDDVLLIFEQDLVDQFDLDEDSEVEVSTDGRVVIIKPRPRES